MTTVLSLKDIQGQVCPSERMEFLTVAPLDLTHRYTLAGTLRRLLGRPLRLTPGGVLVPASAAPLLLDRTQGLALKWTETARRYAENRKSAFAEYLGVRQEVERIKESGPPEATALLSDLDDYERLDGHQLVNVAAMCVAGSPGLCVFDEQGAGKTVTVIFAFDLLSKRDEVDIVLVIAPKSMLPEWPCDLTKFKGDLYRASIVCGNSREKRSALRRAADFFVTNFETAVALEDEIVGLLRARDGRAMLVVDESFYVKNLDARRTQSIRRLREWCSRAFVLCGTPAPNSPEDLVQQFNVVDFGITFDGINVPADRESAVVVVQRAVNERGLYVRHLKRDALPDLPAKTFEQILLPLQPQQLRLYRGALRSLILDLSDIDDDIFQRQITTFLARRMALLQICSHPGMLTGSYTETPAKILALDTILSDLIERRREKVIIWSFFRYSVDNLFRRYARYGAVRYDGSVGSVDERRTAVRQFQEDDETRVFVGNPAAAGAGLTLHRARFAIYESMSNQAAHYLQSLDRIHRRGQARPVEYLVLLAKDTIETDEYDRLLLKEKSAQALLGDVVELPVTREHMLDDLMRAADLIGEESEG